VDSTFFVSSLVSFHFVKQEFALLLYFSTFEQKVRTLILLFADGTSSQQLKETAIALFA